MSASTATTTIRALWAFSGLLSLLGCQAEQRFPDEAAPEIRLSHAEGGEWRVDYKTHLPVQALHFARNPNNSRAERWRTANADFLLERAGDTDVIRRRDGSGFTSSAFYVEAAFAAPPDDYVPFSPFSDGALLIYTGQFHICAEAAPPSGCSQTDARDQGWLVTVSPPADAHVVANGRISTGETTFTDKGNGRMVYVGDAEPLLKPDFIAVLDAALPNAIRAGLNELLPSLMAYFSAELGALHEKPMLFASRDPAEMPGVYSTKGGVLPNQIFLHVYGDRWKEADPSQPAPFIMWFFAHETAHLFQTNLPGAAIFMAEPWIVEGSADVFAARALEKFHPSLSAYTDDRISKALEGCVAALEAIPDLALKDAGKQNQFNAYYDCGFVMNMALDSSVRRTSSGQSDLFDVWSVYIEAIKNGAESNQETYLSAAAEYAEAETVAFLQSFAGEPQNDIRQTLYSGLRRSGLAIKDLDD